MVFMWIYGGYIYEQQKNRKKNEMDREKSDAMFWNYDFFLFGLAKVRSHIFVPFSLQTAN